MKPQVKNFKEKALEIAQEKKEFAVALDTETISIDERQKQLETAIAETTAVLKNIYTRTLKHCTSDSEKQLMKAAENEAIFIIYDAYRK